MLFEQDVDVKETGIGTAVTVFDAKRAPDWVKQAGADAVVKSRGFDPGAFGVVGWDVYDELITPATLSQW